MTASALETLAPYPEPGQATPDVLARWFTVQGFAAYCRLCRHPCWDTPGQYGADGKPAGAYRAALRGFVVDAELAWTRFVAAYLLRTAAGVGCDMPLGVVLRREVDSAETASETLGDWLVGYGIDPESVVQAVEAERAAVGVVA